MFIEIKKIKENIFNFKEFKHYRIIFWKGGSTLCLCYSVVVEARIHEEKRVICALLDSEDLKYKKEEVL